MSNILSILVSKLDSQPGPSNQPFVSVFDTETQNALSNPSEILNVPFLTDDRKILDLELSVIEKETPIYEVFEPSLNPLFSPIMTPIPHLTLVWIM